MMKKKFILAILTSLCVAGCSLCVSACGESQTNDEKQTIEQTTEQTTNDTPKSESQTVVVSGVTLNKFELSLEVGENETLTATVTPDNATDKSITWASSDSAVATVENGKVTAVAAGTTTITAKVGEKTATCTVTVTKSNKMTESEWKAAFKATKEAAAYSYASTFSQTFEQTTVSGGTTTVEYNTESSTSNNKYSATQGIVNNNMSMQNKLWSKSGNKIYDSDDNEVDSEADITPTSRSYNYYYVLMNKDIYNVSLGDKTKTDVSNYDTVQKAQTRFGSIAEEYSVYIGLCNWIKLSDLKDILAKNPQDVSEAISEKEIKLEDAYESFTYDEATDTYSSSDFVISYYEELAYKNDGVTIQIKFTDGKITHFKGSLTIEGDGTYNGDELEAGETGSFKYVYASECTLSYDEPTFNQTQLDTVATAITNYEPEIYKAFNYKEWKEGAIYDETNYVEGMTQIAGAYAQMTPKISLYTNGTCRWYNTVNGQIGYTAGTYYKTNESEGVVYYKMILPTNSGDNAEYDLVLKSDGTLEQYLYIYASSDNTATNKIASSIIVYSEIVTEE
jgi:hypothetical protein